MGAGIVEIGVLFCSGSLGAEVGERRSEPGEQAGELLPVLLRPALQHPVEERLTRAVVRKAFAAVAQAATKACRGSSVEQRPGLEPTVALLAKDGQGGPERGPHAGCRPGPGRAGRARADSIAQVRAILLGR
jgi:hypothetical protein